MAFASIHISNFIVQAIIRAEPALRGCAVAVVEGNPPIEKVVAANDNAFRAGIGLGMTKSEAATFCAVEIRRRSMSEEQSCHAALLDVGWSVSPRIEDTSADTIVLDIAGLHRLLGSQEEIACELLQRG